MENIDSEALWPLDVDDEWITHDGVLQQPPGVLSISGHGLQRREKNCYVLNVNQEECPAMG